MTPIDGEPEDTATRTRRRRRIMLGAGTAVAVAIAVTAAVVIKKSRSEMDDGTVEWSEEGSSWLDGLDWDDFLFLLTSEPGDDFTWSDLLRLDRLRESYEMATGDRL
jgi:hypothetical protein